MERWLFAENSYYEAPLIKPGAVEYRSYQVNIAREALKRNTLVILPTGLGKTVIAALVMAHRLWHYSWGRCILLAPTRPLVLQHAETLRKVLSLSADSIIALTGTQAPEKRRKLWAKARVVCMTPQTLKNDLLAGRYNLQDVVLIVFDEAHRALGNYPYKFIAERYMQESKAPLILALTASPGSEEKQLLEICHNLHIEWIEYRSEKSPDVRPYLQKIRIEWIMVELPEDFQEARDILLSELRPLLKEFKDKGYIESSSVASVRLKDLLDARALIQERLKEYVVPPKDLLEDLSKLIFAARLIHALELLETEGLHSFNRYLDKLEALAARRGTSKYLKMFVGSSSWLRLRRVVNEGLKKPHPKVPRLIEILKRELRENSRAIIFTNYRDTVDLLVEVLRREGFSVSKFIGQSTRDGSKGLTQRQQEEIMARFRKGEYQILVATQVAEEGIDVAECDLVVFYDNVPSAIRYIQRKGRTGRKRAGKVIILITKGTRDEAYYWASIRKRQKMSEIVRKLRLLLADLSSGKQATLKEEEKPPRESEFAQLKIYVDNRELNSSVAEELSKLGVRLIARNLEVADYVLSDEVAVERKSLADFIRSIIDLRLFKQAELLRSSYRRPVLIVEGRQLLSGIRQEAMLGAILSLAIDFGIPVLWTDGPSETARYLLLLAKREQLKRRRPLRIKGERRPLTIKDAQLEMIASIPGIDRVLAERILKFFRTPQRIANATIDELMQVEGIGVKLANIIRRAFTTPYKS